MDEAISTLFLLAFLSLCVWLDNKCKKERAQRERDAGITDQGWGSFDPGDGDGGDFPDCGGF